MGLPWGDRVVADSQSAIGSVQRFYLKKANRKSVPVAWPNHAQTFGVTNPA